MTDILKPSFFKPKGSEIQHTTPSIPPEVTQVQERLERIESALAHPFQTMQDMHELLSRINGHLDALVKDNLIKRQFNDETVSIGKTVNWQLTYKRHFYAYILSSTSFTLQVSNGVTIPITANIWINVSVQEGSYFTVLGGSDTALNTFTVRTCDNPMDEPSSSSGSSFIPANLANSALGAGAGQGVTCTLTPTTGFTCLLYGIIVTAGGGLNAVNGVVTLSDGTLSQEYEFDQTNGQNGSNILSQSFVNGGLKASAVNTAWTVTVPAITNGGTVAISMFGADK